MATFFMTSKGHYPTKFDIIWRNHFQNISRKTNIRSTVPVQLKPEVNITDEKGTPPKTQAFIFGPVNGKLALLLSWLASQSVFCFVLHMKYFVNINNGGHWFHLFAYALHRVVQFPQQHAQTTTFSWFHFWAKWIILQHVLVNLSRLVCIIFRSNFKTFSGDISFLFTCAFRSLLVMFFPRNHQYMICHFVSWPQNYLTTPEAFWTSMFHCFRPAVQFSRETCSRTYLISLAKCLWSLFLTFVMFMKLSLMIGCIYRIEVGCKDGRCGFEISGKHRRLEFVFSMEI